MSLRRSALALTLLSSVALSPSLFAQSQDAPGCATPMRDFSAPSSDPGRGDSEVMDRIEALCERLGDVTEEQKLAAIDALTFQNEQERAFLPGGNAPAGVPHWSSIGPANSNWLQNGVRVTAVDSGRIRTILPHPTDPDTVYVLTSGGGLWKTSNFTQPKPSWTPLTDGVLSTSGGSVAFGRDPNTLYLGVGDPYDVRGLIAGVMLKSVDGGAHWSPFVNLPGAQSVRDVKVDTSGAMDVVFATTDVGLFRSADAGVSYTRVAMSEAWSLAKTRAGWLVTQRTTLGNGFVRLSTDGGLTWSVSGAGFSFNGAGRATLGIANSGDAIVYAFAGVPGRFGGAQKDLYRSTDGGLNFTALGLNAKVPTNPNPDQPNMKIMGGQAWYNQMILVDANDATRNTVYLGGQLSTAKSTDGGLTWTLLSNWLAQFKLPYVHADNHAAAQMSFGKTSMILFGTDGGLFVSTDGGVQFDDSKNEGIVSALIMNITSSPKHPERVMIGLQDAGTRVKLPNSTTWDQTFGGDGEGVAWSQANDAISICSVPGSGMFRTAQNPPNTQAKWDVGYRGIGGLDFYYFFTLIATPPATADATGQVFFHRTGLRIYKTVDGASNWNLIGAVNFPGASTGTIVHQFRNTINGMGVSPEDTNHFAIAALGGFLVQSSNGGATYVERSLIASAPGYAGFNSTVAYANNNVIYVGSENPNFGQIRLLKSTDGGATWSAKQNGLPDVPVDKVVVDPSDATGNTVYAGTWIGVYGTTNGGTSWSIVGAGLPRVQVQDLRISPDGSQLRAGTYGRGAWELQLR